MQTPIPGWTASRRVVDVQRPIDVGGVLHVDPEPPASLARVPGEAQGVLERRLRIEIEAQLGQLGRHVGAEPPADGPVDELVVVGRDLVGLAEIGQVLAQVGEDRWNALLLEGAGGSERVVHVLAGHEAADRASGAGQARDVDAKPLVSGAPQQEFGARVTCMRKWPECSGQSLRAMPQAAGSGPAWTRVGVVGRTGHRTSASMGTRYRK